MCLFYVLILNYHLFVCVLFLTRQNEIILITMTSQYAQGVQQRNVRKDTKVTSADKTRAPTKNKTITITRGHPYRGVGVSTSQKSYN